MSPEISDQELHVFFNYIGQGIWHLQNLEDVLSTYITMKHDIRIPGSVSQESADGFLAKNRKGTLGTLLDTAFKNNVMPKGLEDRFKKFKDERNWLVHRCAYQNRKDLYNSVKRQKLINRIYSFCEEAVVLRRMIFNDLDDYFKGLGLDANESRRLAMAELEMLKNEA